MREYWDARVRVSVGAGVAPTPAVLRHQEYARRRKPLEEALHGKLAAGELAASVLPAVRGPQTPREIVRPGLFNDAELAWDIDEIVGMRIRLKNPEIFDPREVPLNVWDLPDWYNAAFGIEKATEAALPRAAAEPFVHASGYRYVELRSVGFSLSPTQARVIRCLHQAYMKGSPWVSTRDLLSAANSSSEKVAHIFRRHTAPHWTTLIGSDGRGNYWLRIES